nr:PAS domain-containing protein [Brevundimonas variabilis]
MEKTQSHPEYPPTRVQSGGLPGSDRAAATDTGAAPPLEADRLNDVLDAARLGAWEWNIQTGDLRLNARWAEMLGYTLAELQPISIETCARLRHPADQAAALVKAEAHLSGKEPYFEAEVRMRHKAGHWVWILDRARLVSRSADGRPLIMVGAHQDITARKVFEAELARTSERLRLCMDLAGIGVWEMDFSEDGGFSFDNRVREIYGFQVDGEWIARERAMDHVHPDDRKSLRADGQRSLETGLPVQSFFRIQRNDGTVRHVKAHALASRNAEGRSVLVGLNRDISEDVARTAELETKRVEAEAAAVAKGQFLATMSHEIRTPMNGVIGMLTVLQRSKLAPMHQEHAEIALKSATHLLHILDDILEVSRLEAGQVSLVLRDFDPRIMAREVTDLFSRGAVRPGVDLKLDIATDVPSWVRADEDRVRQILTNFVGNAVKFTEAGRIDVEIGYRTGDGCLLIAVKDTGIGISPETCKRLFGRFIQADASTTRRFGGTGLGLSICRQYADLMGGRIGVESEADRGSRFWLEVPAPTGDGASPTPGEPEMADGRCLRLLVAEDNLTNQRVIAALLDSFGHSFTIVPDGEQAVAAVSSGDFDAILMDIQMPVMDGPTATRHIRALGGRASMLPIIALTANAMPGQRAEYLAAGMTDYVAKPIDLRALHAALLKVAQF